MPAVSHYLYGGGRAVSGGASAPATGRNFPKIRFPARGGAFLLTLLLHGLLLAVFVAAFRVIIVRPPEPPHQVVTLIPLAPPIPATVSQPAMPRAGVAPAEPMAAPSRPIPAKLAQPDSAPPLVMKGEGVAMAARPPSIDPVAVDPDAYRKAVQSRIEQARHYPIEAIRRRWQGTALVGFLLHRDGSVTQIGVVRSSGRKLLDVAAREAVSRAMPFPAIPDELPDSIDVTVPILFLLDGPPVQRIATRFP